MDFTRVETMAAERRPAEGDFDFMHGAWRVHHRRLRELGWPEAPTGWNSAARCTPNRSWAAWAISTGTRSTCPRGATKPCTLRLFDPRHAAMVAALDRRARSEDSTRHSDGAIRGWGSGTFFGDDSFRRPPDPDALPLVSDITPDTARWEQAFSADGGADLGNQLDHGVQPAHEKAFLFCRLRLLGVAIARHPCSPRHRGAADASVRIR